MEPRTHLGISLRLVGQPVEISPGVARVRLETLAEMSADDRGLVHGGFTFGLADYAAMLAVNDPNVVLGAAQTRFLAPVVCGEVLEATARVVEEKGKKRQVECVVMTSKVVFEGVFTCYVLDGHVLDAQG
ncbi:thioesterase [Desulfuromonas versatilis]|uniref:Thioesterase n=1 Tax=Desulfuromonas versatilis TaxID=2802975 RepID=A0ABM8HXA0_9BACT|nr:PaaI family thioesterase [Desulfuromonas versatilis]BCR05417.1 thioesterase [Desulfuromonas versatilis]